MRGLRLNFILISTVAVVAHADNLPSWITNGPTFDRESHFIVCSAEALDPQEAEQLAQSRCLANAAMLPGVVVKVRSKTVESITGADASEIAEIEPISRSVRCRWDNRFLERQEVGYRVWLRCAVPKHDVGMESILEPDSVAGTAVKLPAFKRAIVIVASVPPAEMYVVGGVRGERVISATTNPTTIELEKGDELVIAKRHGYHDTKFGLHSWKNGDVLNLTLRLKRGL